MRPLLEHVQDQALSSVCDVLEEKHRELRQLVEFALEPEVRAVLRYARSGRYRRRAERALVSLERALYERAADKLTSVERRRANGANAIRRRSLAEIDNCPVGVVLAAARGRLELDNDRPITIAELVALTGMRPERAYQAARRAGAIGSDSARGGAWIEPAGAREVLATRGIAGFRRGTTQQATPPASSR